MRVLVILVVVLAVAALAVGAIRRRAAERAGAALEPGPVGIPCMLRREAEGTRWRAGTLLPGTPVRWQPTPARGRPPVDLPADLRRTGVRSPSVREGISINPGSTIVECGSDEGAVLIAVMPLDHAAVRRSLPGD
ncbi:hypothetical protein [Streptomyces sp. NPDC060194]|uniref:hypothetical protein n=1 Tax=Streptomyces sp. NPDC060194 TaxID=3347069 RepID=UPI00365A8CF6